MSIVASKFAYILVEMKEKKSLKKYSKKVLVFQSSLFSLQNP
jgi:hypothetical protein